MMMTMTTTMMMQEVASSSSSTKSIYDLLHERPTNWEAVKKRSAADSISIPKDFIAQLFIAASPGPSLPDFEWFMMKFGKSAGYFGLGLSKEEVNADWSLRLLAEVVLAQLDYSFGGGRIPRESMFRKITSWEAAEAIMNSFLDSRCVSQALSRFMFSAWYEDDEDDRLLSEKWDFYKNCLEAYSFKLSELSRDTMKDIFQKADGTVCLGHALFHVLFRADGTQLLDDVLPLLSFIKTQDPKAFLQRNADNRTLLHLILHVHEDELFSLIHDDSDEVLGGAAEARFKIITFLLKEDPQLARMPDGFDDLPLHTALKHFTAGRYMDELVELLYKAAPTERRCLPSGLYPFQLAASRVRGRSTCGCDHCSIIHDKHGVSISSVYTLLRQCPHLIVAGSARKGLQGKCDDNKRLSDERFIGVAKDELQLARKRLTVERLNKELMQEENDARQKKRRLVYDLQVLKEGGEVSLIAREWR